MGQGGNSISRLFGSELEEITSIMPDKGSKKKLGAIVVGANGEIRNCKPLFGL